jgi:hypothetical protein
LRGWGRELYGEVNDPFLLHVAVTQVLRFVNVLRHAVEEDAEITDGD